MTSIEESRVRMTALYGENHRITDGSYDKSLAVKCINGTFVGKRYENVIAYRGIPFVGKQPVGEYRWKAPVEFTPDDGVYEAHYFGTVPPQNGDPMQIGSLYPQSEACLYLNVWRAEDSPEEKAEIEAQMRVVVAEQEALAKEKQAQGQANAAKVTADAEAYKAKISADAEAYAREVQGKAEAAYYSELSKYADIIETLRKLDIEAERAGRWDGKEISQYIPLTAAGGIVTLK